LCAVGEALRWAVGQALLEVDDYSIRLRPEDLRLIVRLLVDQLIESECFPTALAWLGLASLRFASLRFASLGLARLAWLACAACCLIDAAF
jgi:hypothetical protein